MCVKSIKWRSFDYYLLSRGSNKVAASCEASIDFAAIKAFFDWKTHFLDRQVCRSKADIPAERVHKVCILAKSAVQLRKCKANGSPTSISTWLGRRVRESRRCTPTSQRPCSRPLSARATPEPALHYFSFSWSWRKSKRREKKTYNINESPVPFVFYLERGIIPSRTSLRYRRRVIAFFANRPKESR